MECNIDERGARFRRVMGIVCLVLAAALGGVAFWTGWVVVWIVAGAAAAGGLFALFESRKKWCALRAMGIQTRV